MLNYFLNVVQFLQETQADMVVTSLKISKERSTVIDFSTDDGKALATIADAMKAADLKPDQGPVMDIKPAQPAAAPTAP